MQSPRVVKGFDITPIRTWFDEQIKTCEWHINPKGPGRRMAFFNKAPLYNELFDVFSLKSLALEPKFKIFIGNNFQDGAFVHEHQDDNLNSLIHARINVMVKKPPKGGNPTLGGQEIQVNEGDIWLCISGKEMHGSKPISGGERYIVSYGGLFLEEDLMPWINNL